MVVEWEMLLPSHQGQKAVCQKLINLCLHTISFLWWHHTHRPSFIKKVKLYKRESTIIMWLLRFLTLGPQIIIMEISNPRFVPALLIVTISNLPDLLDLHFKKFGAWTKYIKVWVKCTTLCLHIDHTIYSFFAFKMHISFHTYIFLQMYYKGDPFRKLGPNSSSGCCKLSFEPSATSLWLVSLFN